MNIPYLTILYIFIQLIIFISNCTIRNKSINECIMPTSSADYFSSVIPWTLGCDTNPEYEEIWRYITYPFFHYGIIHLLFNCLSLSFLGSDLELLHGKKAFIIINVIGNVCGPCFFQINNYVQDKYRYLVGSSVSIYALIGSRQINILCNLDTMSNFEKKWRTILLFTIVVNDIIQYYVLYNPIIAYSAHFGGFVAGTFASTYVLKNFNETDNEKKIMNIVRPMMTGVCLSAFIISYSLPLHECVKIFT